jgi:UDP-N-acetylglucosamine acyltransferase
VTNIHPTAIVAPGARLGASVEIGPFCTVGPDVELGDGARLISHVVVDGHTTIGAEVALYPFCTVGLAPQDLKYKGEVTRTEVGPRTAIREHVTVHRGTAQGGGLTRVGADCLVMAVTHVAHDCRIGNGVIIANNVVMGGHVEIGDNAVVGGSAAIHQFVRIGRGTMIGGVSGVEADVVPFGLVIGNRARLAGVNVIGLRRRGYDRAQVHQVRAAYRAIFWGEGVFADRLAEVRARCAGDPLIDEILAFIDAPSKRGLVRAGRMADEDGDA